MISAMFEGQTKSNMRGTRASGHFGGAMMPRLAICLFLLMAATAACATGPLQIQNDIFVERLERTSDGKMRVRLEEPEKVRPGDNLVFVLRYKNADHAPRSGLIITNPLPRAVAYAGSHDGASQVSVDDGRHWGHLDRLRIALPGGKSRAAVPEDVTHIRWNIAQSVPAGGEGKFIYRARVR